MRVVVATPELFVSIGKGGDLFPIPADRVFLKTLRGNRRIRKKSALAFNGNTVQKVAGTLRVPSADSQKALLFVGRGTWNVPTTLLR